MKLLMLGTGPFAVPTFRRLAESRHDILALITRPITDPGKRRKSAANPMRDLAEQLQLSILDPANVNDSATIERLAAYESDLMIVCDFGQILSKDCLGAARKGGINLHASLLPKYRGAAPVNWAIYHGEETTGVTVIHMSPKLDAGPSLVQLETEIRSDETAADLEPRLAELGVSAVLKALDRLEPWEGVTEIGEPQDASLASRAPRLRKEDGLIDWNRTATQLVNQIRAFQPWPASYTYMLPRSGGPIRLIIHRATAASEASTPTTTIPGTIHHVEEQGIQVHTGAGLLELQVLQAAGKRSMTAREFLCGRSLVAGERLGNSP